MVKINHEVPLCLLEDSKKFNDYQYALVHLLEENEEYRKFFLKCKEEGIPIYLDNSLHELGYAIEGDILSKWISILEPECVFIPDYWEDALSSMLKAKQWVNIKVPNNTLKVPVVQALNYEEAKIVYDYYKHLGYTKIAFSYGASYYSKMFGYHPNTSLLKAMGRLNVICKLWGEGIIRNEDKIHLLGTACPIEFKFYNFPFIDSIDTSNPIMAALDGFKYNSKWPDHSKPKSNMNECFDILKDQIDMDLVNYNVEQFKNLINK